VVDEDCEAPFYCRPVAPSTGLLGVCQAFSITGGPCGFAQRCAGHMACPGYSQRFNGGNVDGECRPAADVGQPCVPVAAGYDFGDTGCFAELTCNPDSLRCEVAPALGEPCTADGRCGFQAFCDDERVCRAKKGHGAEAGGPQECLDTFNPFLEQCADPERECAG